MRQSRLAITTTLQDAVFRTTAVQYSLQFLSVFSFLCPISVLTSKVDNGITMSSGAFDASGSSGRILVDLDLRWCCQGPLGAVLREFARRVCTDGPAQETSTHLPVRPALSGVELGSEALGFGLQVQEACR